MFKRWHAGWTAMGILCLGLGLAACAGLPLVGLIGQGVSVNVPSEIPFPDTLTLDLAPQGNQSVALSDRVMGLAGGGGLEQRLGQVLRSQTVPLRRDGAQAFKQQLQQSGLFGGVVEQGGTVGFSVGVSRFGVAYDGASRTYHLVLDLQASLSEPHLGVIWQGQRSVVDLGANLKAQASRMELATVLIQPDGLRSLGRDAIADLSRQLLEDLRQHPPTSPLGNLKF